MSDIFGRLKSGAGKVAKEADKAAHVKRIEFDIGGLKKQIEGLYTKLGELTYKSIASKEPQSSEVTDICAKINNLKEQISLKEDEIKKIQSDAEKPPVATPTQEATSVGPQKMVCPSCGKENDANVKFCSECGTKMN